MDVGSVEAFASFSESPKSVLDADPTTSATAAEHDDAAPSAKRPRVANVSSKLSAQGYFSVEQPFDPDVLKQHLMPVLEPLYRSMYSVRFHKNGDNELSGASNARVFAENPIDLETIRANLESGSYNHAWEFCDDVWRLLENAFLQYPTRSVEYLSALKLREMFSNTIDPVMRKLGYCCGQRYSFTPSRHVCFADAACRIEFNQPCYMYQDDTTFALYSRYYFCVPHFKAITGARVNIGEHGDDLWVKKTAFSLLTNDRVALEPLDECRICGRRVHRICAMHFDGLYLSDFVCDTCRTNVGIERPPFQLTAETLPHCQLSLHIEQRLNDFYKWAVSSVEYAEVLEAPKVFIRVLNCANKSTIVNRLMRERYAKDGYPSSFPYRSKAIFVFEVIDGAEVCLFGLYVQEYDSECPEPNRGRVYMSFLGSVNYFRPKVLRTATYHEILLGYLEYVKSIGYEKVHLTAVPPTDGDDYVFLHHPPDMKIPSQSRLVLWYRTMLTKGQAEGIVVSYRNLHQQGDVWPEIFDQCILDAEEEMRKRTPRNGVNERGRGKQLLYSGAFDLENASEKHDLMDKRSKLPAVPMSDQLAKRIKDKLYKALRSNRNYCLVIDLRVESPVDTIVDPDPLIRSIILASREEFLAQAEARNWEWSSLRRAKWSTKAVTFLLHSERLDFAYSYSCDQSVRLAR
ncbi:CREB-binding protein-like protein [Aphelenchoides avenae]|nr:CREB-binding protein-like protein [Aphelenchus avenae]